MPWVVVFACWTLLVWGGRVRNIVGDDALDGWATTWRVGLAVAFLVLAAVVLVPRWRRTPVIRALAGLTVFVWLIRGTGILLDDHDTAFKVVHTALALASIAVAAAAVRAAHRRDHAPLATPA